MDVIVATLAYLLILIYLSAAWTPALVFSGLVLVTYAGPTARDRLIRAFRRRD
jgi:hypothetical protein